jgi:hypothetical protein
MWTLSLPSKACLCRFNQASKRARIQHPLDYPRWEFIRVTNIAGHCRLMLLLSIYAAAPAATQATTGPTIMLI